MKGTIYLWITLFLGIAADANSQTAINSEQFFLTESPATVTISTDLGTMLGGKLGDATQTASFSIRLPDSSLLTEEIELGLRGHFRRQTCLVPPIRLLFRNEHSPRLSSLKTLKLVNVCRYNSGDVQLLLREYLIYKIYNIITEKSLRARLLNLTFTDSKSVKKPFTQYAFLLEPENAMQKRNKCRENKELTVEQEQTDRAQMTLVSLFEYMIGNTDWAVWKNHNIMLMYPKKDSTAKPFPVAYDFDYSGLVNADYAIPDPMFGTESVRQRVYRGFPRTMEELSAAIQLFNNKKDKIYELINNFQPLSAGSKKSTISYLDEFFRIINNPIDVKNNFIDQARKQ